VKRLALAAAAVGLVIVVGAHQGDRYPCDSLQVTDQDLVCMKDGQQQLDQVIR
jgi:hypothetical protein